MEAAQVQQRVGLVGAGAVARAWHVPTLAGLAGVRLVAVTDRQPEAATALARQCGARACTFDELIADCDWVVITTPPSSHAELASRALAAGRLVLVEKPFVTSTIEADRLVAQAGAGHPGLYVAQLRRFAPAVNLAADLVRAGVIGEVRALEVFEGGRFGWETASRYVQEDPFGGVLFDTGSHSLDQALYAAGLTESPLAVDVESVQRDRPEPAHALSARFVLHGESGRIQGHLRLSRYETLANLIRVRGDRGTLEFGVGFDRTVWLRTDAGVVSFQAAGAERPIGACFAAQYRSVRDEGPASRLAARTILNQVRVLAAIHAHPHG